MRELRVNNVDKLLSEEKEMIGKCLYIINNRELITIFQHIEIIGFSKDQK